MGLYRPRRRLKVRGSVILENFFTQSGPGQRNKRHL